jgi:hypothetical protein
MCHYAIDFRYLKVSLPPNKCSHIYNSRKFTTETEELFKECTKQPWEIKLQNTAVLPGWVVLSKVIIKNRKQFVVVFIKISYLSILYVNLIDFLRIKKYCFISILPIIHNETAVAGYEPKEDNSNLKYFQHVPCFYKCFCLDSKQKFL